LALDELLTFHIAISLVSYLSGTSSIAIITPHRTNTVRRCALSLFCIAPNPLEVPFQYQKNTSKLEFYHMKVICDYISTTWIGATTFKNPLFKEKRPL